MPAGGFSFRTHINWGTKWLTSQNVWRKSTISMTQNIKPAVVKVLTMSRSKGVKQYDTTIDALPDPIGDVTIAFLLFFHLFCEFF
jgi:hypothetical protein